MSPEKSAKQYLIVGGGVAGVSAAETIFKNQPDADITIICAEANLPYFRLNLTMYLSGAMDASKLPMHPEEWYLAKHIELLLETRAEKIDPERQVVFLSDGRELPYDKLIIANGASPFVPPIKGVELHGVQTLRTKEDADHILEASKASAHVICLGGGLLGLEVAGAIAQSGGKVTVLEAMPWLLPRQLDEDASKNLQARIEGEGVKVIVGTKTQAIVGDGHVQAVVLEDGQEIPADLVVISAGVRPNTALACTANVAVNRGILVDSAMRTTVPNVLAAGDVVEFKGIVYGQWVPSNAQGKVAGLTAVGQEAEFEEWTASALLKVMGFNLFSIGKIAVSEPDEFVIAGERDGNYYSFIFGQDLVQGAILIGDTSISRFIKRAIDNQESFAGRVNPKSSLEEVLALFA